MLNLSLATKSGEGLYIGVYNIDCVIEMESAFFAIFLLIKIIVFSKLYDSRVSQNVTSSVTFLAFIAFSFGPQNIINFKKCKKLLQPDWRNKIHFQLHGN